MKKKVMIYVEEDCPLCDEALVLLEFLQQFTDFEINQRFIKENDVWLEKYQLAIPVIEIDGSEISGEDIEFTKLEQLLS